MREALGKRPARAEKKRLDGGMRKLELLGDLLVGEPLPLAEQKRAALLLGHSLEGIAQAEKLVALVASRGHEILDRFQIAGRLDEPAPVAHALPGQADVLRDRVQPCRLELGDNPSPETHERVHEGRLNGVLSLFAVTELAEAKGVDLALVALVEPMRREALLPREREWLGSVSTNRWSSSHLSPSS